MFGLLVAGLVLVMRYGIMRRNENSMKRITETRMCTVALAWVEKINFVEKNKA